jgi:hypothetical protein
LPNDFGINKMARAVSMVPKPELPYMTVTEYNVMGDLLAAGQLSAFRVKKCVRVGCGRDVVNSKEWCSKVCWERDNNIQTEKTDGDEQEEG